MPVNPERRPSRKRGPKGRRCPHPRGTIHVLCGVRAPPEGRAFAAPRGPLRPPHVRRFGVRKLEFPSAVGKPPADRRAGSVIHSPPAMRVLICDCGYVGAALDLLLSADHYAVFGLRHDPSNLPPAIRPLAADLSEPLSPEVLPADLDAAVSPSAAAGSATEVAYRAARLRRRAAQPPRRPRGVADRAAPHVRLQHGVYGQTGGEWVNEDPPAEPRRAFGKRLLEG